ncbi:MAG: hypothetical protein ACM3O7_02865 [Acidobacteriota bacterium]
MRRAFPVLLLLLAAAAAQGATSYFLDRSGMLWNAVAAPEGLVLTAQRDGQEVVHSVVPFQIGLAGTSDTQIQVAADELTGKVSVVWQRNWSDAASEIMLAVWKGGDWERVTSLTRDINAHPRNPAVLLTETDDTVADPDHPDDPSKAVTFRDSYLNVVWWEGTDQQHASFALLRLPADGSDASALTTQDLDRLVTTVGLACQTPLPADLMAHPLFASQSSREHALVFFGSEKLCLFYLVEVGFQWQLDPSQNGDPIAVTAQRRRSTPVFGVREVLDAPREISLEGARVLVGSSLRPVTYRVDQGTIEYVVATDQGWSPKRTISVAPGLTLDQAIPLVENLAR